MSDVGAQHEPSVILDEIMDDVTIPSSPIEILPLSPNELRTLTERMNIRSGKDEWKDRAAKAADDFKWQTLLSTILSYFTSLLSDVTPTQVEHFMAFNTVTAEAFLDKLNGNQLKLWKEAVQKGVDNNDWTDLFRLFVQPSRKHPRSSPPGDDDHEVKRKQIALQRKWTINGAIREDEAKNLYYSDSGTQQESKNFQGTKRNITPTGVAVGIDVIDQRIEQELKSLRVVVEKFLKNPEPPTWVPPDYATPTNRDFLTNLRIPSYYLNGNPSLLFHDLHACDGEEIEKIFGDVRHLCICNTSGSGKTRRMLESLTKYWGFYLVAVPDVNGVGIRDLGDILNGVTDYHEWLSDLKLLSVEDRAIQSERNSTIASKLLKKVLAARIVVFQLFLDLAIQVDGELQEKHKRIWLLFQLSDQLNLHDRVEHPFVRIMRHCLPQASVEALDILVERFDTIRINYLHRSHFIVGLDEAQQVVRLYPNSFISSTNNQVLRSILREIVKVFTKPSIKLVVSGTGLSLDDLQDAMTSGVSKPAERILVYHELGMFDTWPRLKAFLERYIPASFLETPSGYCLQQRIREYLLGRYRFSVSFLEYLLRNGLQSPHKLLNEYIKGHTTCLPGDSGHPFTLNEPELRIEVQMIGFEWNRLQNDPAALQEAAQIVQSHLIMGTSPTFGPVTARLVEYGIAHLRKRHEGQIIEPLAFLSLMKWLENQPTVNLQTNIRSRLANQRFRGEAYEQLIVLYLLRALHYPVSFNTIFQFHGTPPLWADEKAQIVGHLDGAAVAVDILGKAPQNPGLGVVQFATDIEDVLEWIENPTTTAAVLVPTPLFGPDVMIWCRDVLLMGQLKSYTQGNKDSLDAKTISHALTSLSPDHWFKQSPRLLRQRLIHAIGRHRVLRFVGGYPLPPNLNLGGNSVRNVLTMLGSDVLATINLDMFRAHFVTENQARDVLGPMEHALARQREMDR